MTPAGLSGLLVAAALSLQVTSATSATAASSASSPAGPASQRGSLTVSPPVQVVGQAVRLTGVLNRSGRRQVTVQANMNRPGDVWRTIPGSVVAMTDRRGAFDVTFPAPAMHGVSYRIAGGDAVSPAYLFNARPQEITLSTPGRRPNVVFHDVDPGETFSVVADTTPDVYPWFGSPLSIPGRTVLLQERLAPDRWRTLDRGTTDLAGDVAFSVTAPDTGTTVLRARQERWTKGGDAIGWRASFPVFFSVRDPSSVTPRTTRLPVRTAAARSRDRGGAASVAATRFRWGAMRFGYEWEQGQDLDSPPTRGRARGARWLETSDGTGRVTSLNGALALQSKLAQRGPGDLGTTTATLRGHGHRTGRWEFLLELRQFERGATPYRFLLELVPDRALVATCSPRSIVVLDTEIGSARHAVGLRSRDHGAVWTRVVDRAVPAGAFTVAVEVGRRHVTWFENGRPIATTSDRDARLGVGLVPRLSLVGGSGEMNAAQADVDWQRSYEIAPGRQVTRGRALTRMAYADDC